MPDSTGSTGSALPPSFEEPVLLDDAPGWPRHIGTLSIIWVVIGATCAGCGLFGTLAMPQFIQMIPEEQRAKAAQPPVQPLALVLLAGSLAMAVLLLIAAINTLRRKAIGRTLHLAWAGLTLLLIVVGVVDGVMHWTVVEKWAQDHPNADAAKFMSKQSMVLQTLGFTAIRCAWPVFCLVWFGLVKRTPESMTGARLPSTGEG
jgi:hypothetical protein